MSLHVNLKSPDIANAHQDVLNARGIDWVVLAYKKASNDLKVQSTGNGPESLEEEFSDGRYFAPFSQTPNRSHNVVAVSSTFFLESRIRMCALHSAAVLLL